MSPRCLAATPPRELRRARSGRRRSAEADTKSDFARKLKAKRQNFHCALVDQYPKQLRDRHGEEILKLCRDVYGAGFSPRAAGDLLWNGLSARLGAAPGAFEDWLERPAREGRGDRFLARLLYDARYGLR